MQKQTLSRTGTRTPPKAQARVKAETPTVSPVWVIAVMVIGAGLLALI